MEKLASLTLLLLVLGVELPVGDAASGSVRNVKRNLSLTCATMPTSGQYNLIAKHSRKALSVQTGSTNVVQNPVSAPGDNLSWSFEATTGGYYQVKAIFNGKALDVQSGSLDDGEKLVISNASVDPAAELPKKQWCFVDVGDGFYKIVNKKSGKVVDVDVSGQNDGAKVYQWAYSSFESQQWRLQKAEVPQLTKSIQVVYAVPKGAQQHTRASIVYEAVKKIQAQWSSFGYTFKLEPRIETVFIENDCSYFQARDASDRIVSQLKSKGHDDTSKMYATFLECAIQPVAGGNQEVNSQYLGFFGRFIDEIAENDSISIGDIGAEIGASMGLPRENCNGLDTVAAQQLTTLNLSSSGTTSVMCSGPSGSHPGWPQITAPVAYQKHILETNHCDAFWECAGKDSYKKPAVDEWSASE